MQNNTEKKVFLQNLGLKKKNVYSKKITSSIVKLKNLLNDKQTFKVSSIFKSKQLKTNTSLNLINRKRGFLVVYLICITFSPVNTFLHVMDALGNLKFSYSAGSLSFKGKQKKNRFQILNRFFFELRKLKKFTTLESQPIILQLNNVKAFKHLIVRRLKNIFFIRFIKNYNSYSYNGCRKKKKLRKR